MNVHVINEGAPLESSPVEEDYLPIYNSNESTFWIVDPKRKFYKDLHWFHKGGNLLGVTGFHAHKVKRYIQAHEQDYQEIDWLEHGGNRYNSSTWFFAFRNGHQYKTRHTSVDALFDRLITHFSEGWHAHDGFAFEHMDRYRR